MKTIMRGVVHGRTIQLPQETGLPEGQEVAVTLEAIAAHAERVDEPLRWEGNVLVHQGARCDLTEAELRDERVQRLSEGLSR